MFNQRLFALVKLVKSASAFTSAVQMVRAAGFRWDGGKWVQADPLPLEDTYKGMRMAKASEEDLAAALAVSSALESFEKGYNPGETDDRFDIDDPNDCHAAMVHLLDITKDASIFRVIFGMTVVIDRRNEVVDPDADHLAVHPKWLRAMNAVENMKKAAEPQQVNS